MFLEIFIALFLACLSFRLLVASIQCFVDTIDSCICDRCDHEGQFDDYHEED